jgi:hypothetical protein
VFRPSGSWFWPWSADEEKEVMAMNFANGMLNLTNWLGNVIMPIAAGLFAAAAIFNFTKGRNYQHLAYAALASLMCSGLLRALECARCGEWHSTDME